MDTIIDNDYCTTYDNAYDVSDNKITAGARVVAARGGRKPHNPSLIFGTVVGFIEPDVDRHDAVLVAWDNDPHLEEYGPDEILRRHRWYDFDGYFDLLVIS